MAHSLIEEISVSDLARALGCKFHGRDFDISAVGAFSEAGEGTLVFCSSLPTRVTSGAIVIGAGDISSVANTTDIALIISVSPRLDFMRALEILNASPGFAKNPSAPEIHPTAIIGQNVVIEPGCHIGENVVIEHNVVIHSGTTVGEGSRIRAGATIGGDGFGFERGMDGKPVKFIHLGGVKIGRHVEVGSNTCVARGTLGFTTIEDYVKIDNLVHIAHNCHIKSGAFIIACAEVSGGVQVGCDAWVGPNASIIQKVTIGDAALVGLGAVVVKNVPPESIFAGNPAKFFRKVGVVK